MAALDFPATPSNGQTYTPVGSAITYTYSSSKGSWQGSLSGSTGLASLITVADESSDTTSFPLFVTAATGDLGPKSGTNLTFNSSSGLLVATGITADLTGTFGVDLGSDAEGDTYYRDSSGNFVRLARGSDDHVLTMNGNVPNWEAASGGGGVPTAITVADESSDTTCFPLFGTAATGDLGPKTGTNLTFNSSSGLLVATGITADLTGTFGVDLGSDAEGDTYYRDSSGNFVRLAKGTDDHVLTMNGNVPNWEAASGGGASALDDLSDVKFEGANFTDSIKIGDVTTGTLSSAARNIIIGKDAGNSITTANDCIIIGDSTQVNISDSIDSVIIGGNSAAKHLRWSVSVGYGATTNGTSTGNADHCTHVGYLAGSAGATGHSNTYLGSNTARYHLTVGSSYNTAVGTQALYNGGGQRTYNTALGYQAGAGGSGTAEESYGTYLGYKAGYILTTGDNNIFIGKTAGDAVTTGSNNIILGDYAGTAAMANEIHIYNNTTERLKIDSSGAMRINNAFTLPAADGSAGQHLQTAGNGTVTWETPSGGGGASALDGLSDVKYEGTDFTNSLKIGSVTTGTLSAASANVFIGKLAGDKITNATSTTAIGYRAAEDLTSGDYGVYIGYDAGKQVSTSNSNTIVGAFAGRAVTGWSNTFIGQGAARNGPAGNTNVFIGNQAGYGDVSASGSDNIGIGYDTLKVRTSGAYNIIIGYKAGDLITSGDNNLVIGKELDVSSATVDGEIVIGTDTQRIHVDNSGGVQFNSAYRFPVADGTAYQHLQTAGNGTVTWSSLLSNVELKDFSETVNILGSVSGSTAIDYELGQVITATIGGATTFTFTNPPATGKAGTFTLLVTNPTTNITWPGSVDWPGGTAPTLTTTGLDILTFTTVDGGTIWHGMLASEDSK